MSESEKRYTDMWRQRFTSFGAEMEVTNMGKGETAAAELQARIDARAEVKSKRDSKLREEWLGREFELEIRHELFGIERLRMRLEAYDPIMRVVKMRPLWGVHKSDGKVSIQPLVPWTTDTFWSLLKAGQISPV